MPDPTNPTDPTATPPVVTDPAVLAAQTAAQTAYNDALKKGIQNQRDFNVAGADSVDMLSSLQGRLAEVGINLEDMGNLSGVAATKFGLLSTFAVGATEQFKRFNQSVDTGRLGSFTDQMQSLLSNVTRQGTALNIVSGAGKKLVDVLGSMGATSKDISEAIKGGGSTLAAYAKNVLMSADNTLRFESALMDAAQQAGNTNELYKATGAHLEKLNDVYGQFAGAMSDSMLATHKSTAEIGQYAIAIAAMPGGLEAMSKSMEIAGQKTSLLTAMIQFADGAGIDHNKMLQDTNKAVAQFGIGTQDAFRYTARLADMSTDLGAKQADVGLALSKTSDAFRLYNMHGTDSVKMSQNLADTVKSYAASLEAAGVPAQTAIELGQKYTAQMADMSEAQESFISQQTGGPGGLAGSFAFEKLLREDPAKAAEKQRETMKKLSGGNIVTLQQAEDNPALQMQYEKQRQLLMSGTLGVKANSKAEADMMSQALAEGKPITDKGTTSASQALSDYVNKGADKEQLSATAVQQMDITAEVVRLQAAGMNLTTIQNAATARSGGGGGGVDGIGRGTNTENVDRLRAAQLSGMHQGEGTGSEKMGSLAGRTINDIIPAMKDAAKSAVEQVTSDTGTPGAMPAPAAPRTGTPGAMPAPAAPRTGTTAAPTTPSLGLGRLGAGGFTPNPRPAGADYTPAGRQVGQALPGGQTAGATTTPAAASSRGTTGVTSTGPSSAQPVPVVLASGSSLTVNFTGKCPHCGSNIHTSEQAAIQSPASVARS